MFPAYYKRISLFAMISYFCGNEHTPSVNNLGYLLLNGFTLFNSNGEKVQRRYASLICI